MNRNSTTVVCVVSGPMVLSSMFLCPSFLSVSIVVSLRELLQGIHVISNRKTKFKVAKHKGLRNRDVMSYMWRSRYNFWLLPNMVDVGLLVQAWKDLEISVQAPIQCASFMGELNLCCKVGTFRFAWHDVT